MRRLLGCVLCALILLPGASNVQLGIYPWAGDIEGRSEELLADLRSRAFLDIDAKVFHFVL